MSVLGSGPPYCMDCKWPLNSDVAKTCPCSGHSGEGHNEALRQARKAQRGET